MPEWEMAELKHLVNAYDGVNYDAGNDPRLSNYVSGFNKVDELVKDFVNTCCVKEYKSINHDLYPHLSAMARNVVGERVDLQIYGEDCS